MKKGRRAKPLSKRTARRKSSVKRKESGRSMRIAAVRAWWILRGVLVGLFLAALIYGGWFGVRIVISHPSLSVKRIVVQGGGELSEDKVRALSGIRLGQPLLTLDLKAVQRRIAGHPRIKNAVVVRQLPDTIQIRIEDRRPSAMVIGDTFYLVDMEGVVLASGVKHSGDYPLITGAGGAWEQGEVAAEALPGVRLLTGFSAFGLMGYDRISEVRLSGKGTAFVSLVDSGVVLVMKTDGSPDQFARLAGLMESNNYDVGAAGYDLRFDGRVIRLPGRVMTDEGKATPTGGSKNGQG